MTRRWRGKSQGGISIALLAKHKRKDQLIDKVLIRAFDFNDRSVKVAAAPPPSARTFEKWSRVSLHERFHHSAFVSVSWYHLELSDKSAKVIPKFCQRYFSDSSHFEAKNNGEVLFTYLNRDLMNEQQRELHGRFSLEARFGKSLIPSPALIPPYASRAHSMWYLHHICFFTRRSWLKW